MAPRAFRLMLVLAFLFFSTPNASAQKMGEHFHKANSPKAPDPKNEVPYTPDGRMLRSEDDLHNFDGKELKTEARFQADSTCLKSLENGFGKLRDWNQKFLVEDELSSGKRRKKAELNLSDPTLEEDLDLRRASALIAIFSKTPEQADGERFQRAAQELCKQSMATLPPAQSFRSLRKDKGFRGLFVILQSSLRWAQVKKPERVFLPEIDEEAEQKNRLQKKYVLSVDELRVVSDYTGGGYQRYNAILRNNRVDIPQLSDRVTVLNVGLSHLPNYIGKVKRGARLPPEIRAKHKVGQVITYESFTSASYGEPSIGPDQFIIQSYTGKNIEIYSGTPEEKEILFRPGTKFRVIEMKTDPVEMVDGNYLRTYVMEEVFE
jgi:hypothetical protein